VALLKWKLAGAAFFHLGQWLNWRMNMRRSSFGWTALAVVVLAWAATHGSSEPVAVAPMPLVGNSPPALVTYVGSSAGDTQIITVIDPAQRAMAIYHVNGTTGEIALKSVRNMTWDLQMVQYNSGKPLPQEVRDMRTQLQQ
jgi:hypothetical protein